MATARLVIVLLILGTVVLLAVQNTSPVLPLVFLGGQTVALPLSVWLLIAIVLGALTTLAFTALLEANGGRGGRSKTYKYRPQPFYEPTATGNASRDAAADASASESAERPVSRSSQQRQPSDQPGADTVNYGREWQDWTNLQSSDQWNDWNVMEQAAQPRGTSRPGDGSGAGTSAGGGIGSWLFGNRKAAEEEQVQQSWQELSDDWDNLENHNYRARGVSPVEDSLEDINDGWDRSHHGQPPRDYEVPQSSKRVYQDGSLYSYSYRSQDGSSQRDNIYAPADDAVYGDQEFDRGDYIDLSQPEDYSEEAEPPLGPEVYGAGGYAGEDLGEPEVAEDGVVDADYRVIVPPAPSGDSPAATESAHSEVSWDRDGEDDDDWSDTEDVLTP